MSQEKDGMSLAHRIRSAGLSVTKIRCTVMRTLISCNRPVRHSDLLTLLQSDVEVADIDRVTLYRNLDALTRSGLVHSVQGPDNVWRYCAHSEDVDGCPGGHSHFLCEKCGEMCCLLDSPLPHVHVPEGYVVHNKQMVLQGICAKCGNAL